MEQFCREEMAQSVFLTYTLTPEQRLDRMALGMIEQNVIPGLVGARCIQIDDHYQLRYEIGPDLTLAQGLRGEVEAFYPLRVWKSIAETVSGVEDYMLEERAFLFSPEYVYLTGGEEARLIYLPIQREDGMTFRQFCRQLAETPEMARALSYEAMGAIQQYLNDPLFSAAAFAQVLGKAELTAAVHYAGGQAKEEAVVLRRGAPVEKNAGAVVLSRGARLETPQEMTYGAELKKVEEPPFETDLLSRTEPAPQEQPGTQAERAEVQRVERTEFLDRGQRKTAPVQPAGGGDADHCQSGQDTPGGTVILSGRLRIPNNGGQLQSRPEETEEESPSEAGTQFLEEEETVFLNAAPVRASLRRLSTGETVEITGTEFCIGRSRRDNDYRVDGNPAVSRWHAKIFYRDGQYFLLDRSSKNLTYLDGVQLERGKEAEIQDGMCLRLADEEFTFTIGQ